MTATATTMPLYSFELERNIPTESDHDVGMSLSPAPSPHATLTPSEAAVLSEAISNTSNISTRESLPVEQQKLPIENKECRTPISGVVSQSEMDTSSNKVEDDSREEKLEARIAQLEQNLASLIGVCNELVRQQESTASSGTLPHRRFDTETDVLSQWPPTQHPILDSPEVTTRRRRRRQSKADEDNNENKPSKTMSMLLLDIAPGESRGPSMIPFTEDLDETGGDSGGEKVSSSSSNSSHGENQKLQKLEAPQLINELVVQNGTMTPIQGSSASYTPETSSTESSPRQRLYSSLKVLPASERNLECQAYASTHLEALRLRRKAGKVRAYSFNDTLAKKLDAKYRIQMEKRSASKVEKKMSTISSPVLDAITFDVLRAVNDNEKSADTFVQLLSPPLDSDRANAGLDVPILSPKSSEMSMLPSKNSITSYSLTEGNHSVENQMKLSTPSSKIEAENSILTLRKNDKIPRENSRGTLSEKDDVLSTTSSALTLKSNNTVKKLETARNQEVSTEVKSKQTMKEYIINDLLNIDSRHQDGSASEDIDANMEEFLRIPFKLENLMWFSLAVCTDSFLYVWTLLPLKAMWGFVCLVCTVLRPGKGIKGIQFHRRHLYALLQCLLVWFVFYHVLCPISIGKLYHWIRGQAMLKLYVLIAIVEVFDRLLCSFGQDAWDSLYWNTTRRPKHPRMLISMIVVGVYVTIHSLFLFVHVATLSVAVNSADNALLTLLISGNFAEIKSTVFKKYNKQNLFKITTSDICERFKLALFLVLILLLNCFQGEMSRSMVKEYYTMCLIVMVAELISDWIKHSFITKFNFIKSTAYFDYALILSGDVTGIGHEGLNLDYTHAAVKRIGLAQIPLVCVTARYLHEALRFTIAFRGNGDIDHPMSALSEFFEVPLWKFYSGFFMLMIVLVGLKIGLGGGIRLIARHYLGGDVIEHLEKKLKKRSNSNASTPKTRDFRTEKIEAKKNT